MRRLRVLHLTDRLSERGGADIHLLGVISAQRTHHVVHLGVGYVDGSVAAPCDVTLIPGLRARTPERVALPPLEASFRPDVIHLHNVVNPWVLEWAKDRCALVTVQDHRAFCPGRGKWTLAGEVCDTPMSPEVCRRCFDDEAYFEHIFTLTARRLEALRALPMTVLSHYMKDQLAAVGVPAGQIHVIPPFVFGLDVVDPIGEAHDGMARDEVTPDEAASSRKGTVALFSGRLVAAKGVEDAVAAWRRSGIALPLVISGTGPERDRLEREYPDVEFLGWVPHHRLSGLYCRAKVLLMPSRWQEPFGIVGLEALSYGVPVAAWESGGIRDWHRGDGLVPWGDIDGLGRAVAVLVGREMASSPGVGPRAQTSPSGPEEGGPRSLRGFEPDGPRVLSGFEPDAPRVLSGFEPDAPRVLSGFEPDAPRVLSGFEPDALMSRLERLYDSLLIT